MHAKNLQKDILQISNAFSERVLCSNLQSVRQLSQL